MDGWVASGAEALVPKESCMDVKSEDEEQVCGVVRVAHIGGVSEKVAVLAVGGEAVF